MHSTASKGERILTALAEAISQAYSEVLAVQARVETDVILRAVTSAIAAQLPVTCAAILMKPDPETSRVVFADITNPGLEDYLDRYVASLLRPGEAPTYGLARKVIETGGPLLLPSISMEQLQAMVAEQARHFTTEVPMPIRVERLSLLMVPMRAGPAIIGTLGLFDWQATGLLTDIDLDWMQRAADRVGITLQNAQLRSKAFDRAERIAAMSDVALAISSGQELRVTFKMILERVASTLHVDAADVLLLDEGGGLSVAATTGFRSGFSADLRGNAPTEAGKRWVIEHNIAAPSAVEWIGQSRRWLLAREGLKSYTAAPLMVRERFAGALEVFNRAVLDPDEEWLSFLDAMAIQAAIALDNAASHAAAHPAGMVARSRRRPPPDLSQRELQILRMVVEGASNREVAEHLHLSQNTIKFHVRQLLEKGEVANRTELATKAVHEGWV